MAPQVGLWDRTLTGALWVSNKRIYLPLLFLALIHEILSMIQAMVRETGR